MSTQNQRNKELANLRDLALTPEQRLYYRNLLATENLPLVTFLINKLFRRHPELLDDLIAEGQLKLTEAADKWNPDLGTLSTYLTKSLQYKGAEMVNSLSSPTHLSRRTQKAIARGELPSPTRSDQEVLDLSANPELIMILEEEILANVRI